MTTTAITATPAPGTAKGKITTARLVDAVKAHATDNYEAGWDVVVETMTDEDIAERIGRARTTTGAIAKVAELVNVQVGRRIDVLSQSGEHDAEVAALVAATKPRRGPAKTGHPVVDRKKAAPAKKAAPTAKPAPTTVKDMTREQKRAVASALIDAAGDLLARWDAIKGTDIDLTDIDAKVAGELIGSWLSYCPGTAWNTHLGARPRG